MCSNVSRAAKIRQLLKTERIIVAPAVGDALGARMVEKTGFNALFVSGSSMANLLTGTLDIGILSYGEIRNNLLNIINATSLPIIADADTGYGGTFSIYRMVREYEAMGIAGIQLEDQVFPKMCAYFSNVSVVPVEEMCLRIKAACQARTDPDFLIIGRTDASASLGFREAVKRAYRYHEAGAEMIFISVPRSMEDIRQLAALPFPVCTSIVEGTINEDLTTDELAEMGFKLVKFPQTLIRASMKAMHDALVELKDKGTTRNIRNHFFTQKQRANYTALDEYSAFNERLSGEIIDVVD